MNMQHLARNLLPTVNTFLRYMWQRRLLPPPRSFTDALIAGGHAFGNEVPAMPLHALPITEKVINAVRKRRILYDCRHPEFKNLSRRKKVWDEVGKELNQSGERTVNL